jgi:octaprenyl-diphosphate synthase
MTQPAAEHELLIRIEELVGPALLECEAVFERELAHPSPFVTDLLSHITRFRGKRLRPILVLLSAAAAGEIRSAHTVIAAVVEMIHTATLVHDDVLDDAEIRRHVATVNTRWNVETSVLLGDFLFTHAFHLAASLDSTVACRLIGASTNRVCVGELTQIRQRGNFDLSEEEYFQIIDGKTAELCAVCGELGASYANVDHPHVLESLREYGRCLGMSFQIADDLLDLTGAETETGKSLGSDLEQQKLTLPLIHYLASCPDRERDSIVRSLQEENRQSRELLHRQLRESESLDYARWKADEYARQARRFLEAVRDTPARGLLEDLTYFAVRREF